MSSLSMSTKPFRLLSNRRVREAAGGLQLVANQHAAVLNALVDHVNTLHKRIAALESRAALPHGETPAPLTELAPKESDDVTA